MKLPANQTPQQDLDAALDNLFNHPNVGPFIARQLIQRLVSANPSPAYVERVARVFADNGRGVRGDLLAVVRAILLDAEARAAPSENSGKLEEPFLRLVQLWRAYGARASSGRYLYPAPEQAFGQAPLRSPSVFNFYQPDYRRPGELTQLGMYSPELQIVNEVFVTRAANWLYNQAERHYTGNGFNPNPDARTVMMDFSNLWSLATSPAQLVDHLDVLLMSGQMSAHMRGVVLTLREQPFVEAAVASGTSTVKILYRHILPNTVAPLVVQATYICASAIITEAILSFIGAGLPPSIPTWGNIIAEARAVFSVRPHLIAFPAVFLSLTVLAINLLGDGLRDALDPRLARRL